MKVYYKEGLGDLYINTLIFYKFVRKVYYTNTHYLIVIIDFISSQRFMDWIIHMHKTYNELRPYYQPLVITMSSA